MAVTPDAFSNSGYQTATGSWSGSHTCTGSDRLIRVKIAVFEQEVSVPNGSTHDPTYNGVPLELKVQHSNSLVRCEIWELVAPATGSNTVAIELPESNGSFVAFIESFAGVHQTTPSAQATTADGLSGNPYLELTIGTDQSWLSDVFVSDDTHTVGDDQTERGNVSGARGSGGSSTQGPLSLGIDAVMTWGGDSDRWAQCSLAILPATGGAAYTLSAASGSYSFTGTAATLRRANKIVAGAGSYELNGEPRPTVTLRIARKLTAAQGTFEFNGEPHPTAALKVARKITAAAGAYTLTGTAAALKASRRITAVAAAFLFTGTAAALRLGHKLVAGIGAYELNGEPHPTATLRVARQLIAGAGSYALNGEGHVSAVLRFGHKVTAAAGSYTLTGTAVAFRAVRKLTASAGDYALTGQNVTLRAVRTMVAAAGSYTFTGTAVTFLTGKQLAAAAGSFALTGTAAGLRAARKIVGAVGAFVFTGIEVVFNAPKVMGAESGAFELVGNWVYLNREKHTKGEKVEAEAPPACCCDGGTEPCDCCPALTCEKAFSLTLSNIEIDFFGDIYTVPGPYCLTVRYNGPASSGVAHQRFFTVEVEPDIWVGIYLTGTMFCCITPGTIGWRYAAIVQIYDSANQRFGAATLLDFSTGSDPGDCVFCAEFITEADGSVGELFHEKWFDGENCLTTFNSGNMTADYVVTDGICDGDEVPCCEQPCSAGVYAGDCTGGCCEDGTNWFCEPTPITGGVWTGTWLSGPCLDAGGTGIIFGTNTQVNGICMQFHGSSLAPFGSLRAGEFWITCDGNVYAAINPTGVDNEACAFFFEQDFQLVGTVTTVHSCDPLDYEITFSAGVCSGSVLRVTE